MKRLVVLVILIILIGWLAQNVNLYSNQRSLVEFLKVFDTGLGEFPDDIVVLDDKIIVSVYYRGFVSISGPRILLLDQQGEFLDYLRIDYSLSQKEEFRIIKLLPKKDGYLLIGTLDEERSGGNVFNKMVFVYLDRSLRNVIWKKVYNIAGYYVISLTEFKGEYYFIVQHYQKVWWRAALVKVDERGEVKIKEIKGFREFPQILSAEDKLFLISKLGMGESAREDELLIAEIDPNSLNFKWSKSYGKFGNGYRFAMYDSLKKEIIIFGRYFYIAKDGSYPPVYEILRLNLKGDILQEVRYYFPANFYPVYGIYEEERGLYLFFGHCGANQIVFGVNNNLEPVFIKTIGPQYIVWPDGIIKLIKEEKNYLIAFGVNLKNDYPVPTDIVVARLNKEFKISNNDFYWFREWPIPSKEEIDLSKSTIKETASVKEVKLVEVAPVSALVGEFKVIESEDKKDLKVKIDIKAKYKISTVWNGGGKLEPLNPLVEAGENQRIDILPDEGWEIENVIVDGKSVGAVNSYTFDNVYTDHKIEVRFKIKEYKISIRYQPSESGESKEITAPYGSNLSFIFSSSDCYYIKEVKVNGQSFGQIQQLRLEIREDKEILILCEKYRLRITTKFNLGGKIEPENPEVLCGYYQTFLIKPDKGYRIKDVLVDGKSVGAVTSYTFNYVSSNHTIEAIFEPLTFIINASAGNGGTISPVGKIEIKYGDQKTFVVVPDKGYKIKDVLVDGKSVGAVTSYTFKNIESDHRIEAIFEKEQIVIKLQIGNTTMYVNGTPQQIDVAPQIVEGRTLLPIRYIVEPLGATVNWDGGEKKVTISLENTVIELWIGKNIARVNGNYKFIDPNNPKVVPLIISGRTMLPVRFIAENLGCQVDWDSITKTITITYPKD